MIITEAPDPDFEKNPKKKRDYIFHVWFYIMLITPLIILYYSSDSPIMSVIIGNWIGIVGITLILSGLIELVINVLSRKRPLISINNRFIIICTCWAALFLFGHYSNVREEIRNNKNGAQSLEQNVLVDYQDGLSNHQRSVKDMLIEASNEQNENCPLKINEGTFLDSTSVLSWNTFQMFYSLKLSREAMNEFYGSVDFDGEEEIEALQEQFVQMYKTQGSLEDFRTKKVILQASYYDINGEILYTLSATPGIDF